MSSLACYETDPVKAHPLSASSVVAVVATGGTIACTKDADGALTPTLSCAELVASCGTSVPTRCLDIRSLDSSSMTLADVDLVIATIHEQFRDPDVCGVVVTHGTDSMVDTSFAAELMLTHDRPVTFTGAQRPADHDAPDGPANLKLAIEYAAGATAASDQPTCPADPVSTGRRGATVVFGGRIHPARGLVKHHTHELSAFSSTYSVPSASPFSPHPAGPPPSRPHSAVAPVRLAGMRIPVVAAWAGAGDGVMDAVIAAEPDGIVVEGLGSGNVSDDMGHAIARALDHGIPVVVTTAVPFGPVEFAYGGAGGGTTLGDLGAIPSGWLRAGQARIALATALAAGVDPRTLIGV
ncbi:asparaginase [Corynebacterium aquatimens]|uniref:asparaginase n=1 Tax=Corynebacterium aquatimens TaxID=1190508 RepID=A0A931GTL8_9CORY|nr:asparaginase [Corynebacterium aquatimens]MBG6121950.1 L-asparaginase [Corynebacterium aquatimens]WJY65512.1 L-asparaginase 2 precursor [Corynebacterium aquatimens]